MNKYEIEINDLKRQRDRYRRNVEYYEKHFAILELNYEKALEDNAKLEKIFKELVKGHNHVLEQNISLNKIINLMTENQTEKGEK